MNVIPVKWDEMKSIIIELGYVGENLSTQVCFECDSVFAEYPDAVPGLFITPPKGNDYPGVAIRDNNNVLWNVTSGDLANKGKGEVQLSFVVDNVVKKSATCRFSVEKSIMSGGEPPDPITDWLQRAEQALGEIPATIRNALEAAKQSGDFKGDPGYSPTVQITDITNGHRVTITDEEGTHAYDVFDGDDGVSPSVSTSAISGGTAVTITDRSGNHTFNVYDGANGVSPDLTVTDIPNGHRITIVDVSGTNTFDVMNGQQGAPGDPTQLIDDATASASKTFSSSKIDEMNTQVLNAIHQMIDDTAPTQDKVFSSAKVDEELTCIKVDAYSKYNILPVDKVPTGIIKDVVITRNDDVFTFSGTASGSDSMEGKDLDLIPGEKYTARIYTTSTKNVAATVRYVSNGVETSLGAFGSTSNERKLTFTCPTEYDRIYIKLGVNKNVIYDSNEEFKISIALGEDNPNYVKYGEGTSAFDGYARIELLKTSKGLAEIKNFVTPEMFGAKGDGVANDTQAVINCIAFGISHNLPVFGFRTYRIRQAITIECDNGYFYFNSLHSNDSIGELLTIKGKNNAIKGNTLSASGTNTKALVLVSDDTIQTTRNHIQIQRVLATGNAIELYGDDSNGEPSYVSYNTFIMNLVKSDNGNAIHHGKYSSENQFFNMRIECPNGWAFYNPTSARVFGASMEANVLNGIYADTNADGGGFTFYGCRHIEMTDKLIYRLNGQKPNVQGGTLIKIVGPSTLQFVYISDSYIPYQAIDTSEMTDYTDPSIDIDPPTEWYARWKRFNTASRGAYIYGKVKYGQDGTKNGGFPIGNSMVIIAGKKICKPAIESTYTITDDDFDMRDNYLTDDYNQPYATQFNIGVADCVIHLAPSYCCMGYNRVIIDQRETGKLCTVYNSYDDQNPIFDGEEAGGGIYELRCTCDLSKAEIQIPGTENYYTGRNDVWTVTKID